MARLELRGTQPMYKHGGKRPRAGRKKSGRPVGVPHRARPFHERQHPTHVTWRLIRALRSLRRKELARVIGRAVRHTTEVHAKRRTGFRVIHFSIQPDHLHLIVEAGSKSTLMRALRALAITIAHRLNKLLGRRGRVIADRYHARDLTTPTAMRNAIVYVLQNHLHHERSAYVIDECSSARWFSGWEAPLPEPDTPGCPALTWLARTGWRRRGGPIRFSEGPC